MITGVADRVPERIAHVIYLDAFVPENGQRLADLIPADRRQVMEALVETEGFGWLLPRFAAPPWERFLPQAWQVTDKDDLAWMLARLRPTPFGFFTRAAQRGNPDAERLRRNYIRCSRRRLNLDHLARTDTADKSAGDRAVRPRLHVRHLQAPHAEQCGRRIVKHDARGFPMILMSW